MKCEKLDVWKKSCNVPVEIYRYFFDFKDQVTRSSLSIPSNIVEGVEKIFDKDMVRFLDIVRASCAELTIQIYIVIKIGYIEKGIGFQWKEELEVIARMLSSLIHKISSDYRLETKD